MRASPWRKSDMRALHTMCSRHKPVRAIATRLGRTEGAVRQMARRNGLSVGIHQRHVATARKRAWAAKRLGLA